MDLITNRYDSGIYVCVKGFTIYRAVHKNDNVERGEIVEVLKQYL